MATLPGAWRYRVSAGSGWPGVSILWLGEMERLVCNFCLMWQHVKLSEQIRPWGTLACCWDVKQPSNNYASLEAKGIISEHRKACSLHTYDDYRQVFTMAERGSEEVLFQFCKSPKISLERNLHFTRAFILRCMTNALYVVGKNV